MWCEDCRQEVPGIASSSLGRLCCARCGSRVGTAPRQGQPAPPPQPDAGTRASDALFGFENDLLEELDGWEREVQLRHWEQALDPHPSRGARRRRDAAQGTIRPAIALWRQEESAARTVRRRPAHAGPGLAGYVCLFLGGAALACGVALFVAGRVNGQHALWAYGLSIAGFGQLGLLGWAAMVLSARSQAAAAESATPRRPQRRRSLRAVGEPNFTRSRRLARRGMA